MPVIVIDTLITAPVERVFDLARNIDAHMESTRGTGERAIAGRTSGLIELGEEVTWRARHLGVWQNLTVRITQFDRPHNFRDTMVCGAFQRFDHDHILSEPEPGLCNMRDVFDYTAPFGILGNLADALFLERYMRRFLEERARQLKRMAESADAG